MAIKLPSPITITAVQAAAINAGATAVITPANAIANIDLDSKAKNGLNTINDERWPYAIRTITIHTVNYPSIIPNYLPLADARTNFDTMTKIREQKAILFKSIEALDEISQVAENNVYEFMLAMYENGQRAQKAGTVPGIQAFLDDIGPLFDRIKMTDNTTPPTP